MAILNCSVYVACMIMKDRFAVGMTLRRKTEYSDKNLSQLCFPHDKTHEK